MSADGQLTRGDLAWFVASVLPLPPKPQPNSKEPERRLSRLELARDLEKTLGFAGEARYENARWWRNLNRGMSVLGLIILIAIVSIRKPCLVVQTNDETIDYASCRGCANEKPMMMLPCFFVLFFSHVLTA